LLDLEVGLERGAAACLNAIALVKRTGDPGADVRLG
jgi:hypothetical protein